jgi:predicted TIM-barrel fold metal-dependent hydrolase
MTATQPILGVNHTPPAFDVPAGACDCHVHVFGPAERFPFSPDRLYTPGDAPVADLMALQRTLHLDRVVIVHPSPYGSDNICTLDALRLIGARARGVAVIDAKTSDAALRDMHAVGVRGVRVNIESRGEHSSEVAGRLLREAAARVAPLGWHVQVYSNISVLAPLRDTILALPTPLVVDHFGRAQAALGTAQPGFAELLLLLRSGKVYVKVSAPQRVSRAPDYADAAPLARAMIETNPDRIVWGSDWPHPGVMNYAERNPNVIEPFRPEDDGRALNRLAEWTRNRTELVKILVENPARLYDY